MTKKNELFDEYLTGHLSHIAEPRFRGRKKAFVRHNYAKFLPTDLNARILDIGPGFGELMEWLTQELGYSNVKAIDISEEVVEYCNQLVPDSTIKVDDTATFLENHREQFDCIIMFHVLEHIPKDNVIRLLQSLHSSLAPQGRLLLEVPNMGNPYTGLNIRYADFTHEIGFTELSMQFILQVTGFREVSLFEAGLSNDRWSRPLQTMLQKLMKLNIYLIYRAWALYPPKVLSPVLCVCAVK